MYSFERLDLDQILDAVEHALPVRMSGYITALPSYINRVYELQTIDGTKLIVKFYRPDRWSAAAIADEHTFIKDCEQAELGVVAPLALSSKETIGEHQGIFFSIFPKRAGRQLEINTNADRERLGSLIARMHCVGQTRQAQHRIILDPLHSATHDIDYLCGQVVPERFMARYRQAATELIERSVPLFQGLERIRIHGDCHRGNILDRLEQGLLLIDFDDMAMGPPVQDLWMLLSDRVGRDRTEIETFLQGYERFRCFDRRSIACIEALRAMRMIYFLAWCSRQVDDLQFRRTFPNWGKDAFWQQEINDLREQLEYV